MRCVCSSSELLLISARKINISRRLIFPSLLRNLKAEVAWSADFSPLITQESLVINVNCMLKSEAPALLSFLHPQHYRNDLYIANSGNCMINPLCSIYASLWQIRLSVVLLTLKILDKNLFSLMSSENNKIHEGTIHIGLLNPLP